MTSYTANLRLAKPVVGAETDTWGGTLNSNMIDMIDEAVGGQVSVSVTSGDVTLSTANGSTDQSRPAILILTGTPGTTRNVTFPDVKNIRTVINNSDSTCTLKAGAGTTLSLLAGETVTVYTDGSTNLARLRPQYKEATLTPTITFGGAGANLAYGTRAFEYTKIGNRIFFFAEMILTSKGTSTGAARFITTHPATPASVEEYFVKIKNITLDAGYTGVYALATSTGFDLYEWGSGVAPQALANTNFSNTSEFTICGHYRV